MLDNFVWIQRKFEGLHMCFSDMFWLGFLRQWLRSSRATRQNLAGWEGHSFRRKAWNAPKFHPHVWRWQHSIPTSVRFGRPTLATLAVLSALRQPLGSNTIVPTTAAIVNGWWTVNSVTVSWPSQDKKVLFETEDHKPQSEKDSNGKPSFATAPQTLVPSCTILYH